MPRSRVCFRTTHPRATSPGMAKGHSSPRVSLESQKEPAVAPWCCLPLSQGSLAHNCRCFWVAWSFDSLGKPEPWDLAAVTAQERSVDLGCGSTPGFLDWRGCLKDSRHVSKPKSHAILPRQCCGAKVETHHASSHSSCCASPPCVLLLWAPVSGRLWKQLETCNYCLNTDVEVRSNAFRSLVDLPEDFWHFVLAQNFSISSWTDV